MFINSLLTDLRDSDLCAKIYRIPSNPQGYADDLAAVCLSKRRIDSVMDIVYNHGCTWLYDFNALYGCELWRVGIGGVRILEIFQIYAGKKIQHLYPKSPNICSFFGLGWMRITWVIQVRKLLFIRAVLALDEETLLRKICVKRAVVRFSNENDAPISEEWSIPSGHCTYNVRTLYVQLVQCTYIVRTLYVQCPLGH